MFVGGVERNLSSKVDEVFDSMYIEASLLKSKYKDVSSGIIIDQSKYDHVLKSLMEIFCVSSSGELIELLNSLNTSNAPCVHIKFMFDKFNLSDHLIAAIDDYTKRYNLKVIESTYDSLYEIANHNSKFRPDVNELINEIHKSRFAVETNAGNYTPIGKSAGLASLNQIIKSVSRLEKIHETMLPIIKKNFELISTLCCKIASS